MLLLSACTLPAHFLGADTSMSHTEFLALAINATPTQREAMWKTWRAGERTLDTRLRSALLQSVPDHSGYDPAAAERGLQGLLAKNPPLDVAAIARIRLSELEASRACREEVQNLKGRLAKIADIERELDHNGK